MLVVFVNAVGFVVVTFGFCVLGLVYGVVFVIFLVVYGTFVVLKLFRLAVVGRLVG